MVKTLATPFIFKNQVIENEKGKVRKILSKSDRVFNEFGEIYYSEVITNQVKAWKCHTRMQSILSVAYGAVKFVTVSIEGLDYSFKEFLIDDMSGEILVIPSNNWFGFKGIQKYKSVIMNFADIQHDPNECITKPITGFDYEW